MADTQDFDLEEWQRQQAANAVAASLGQPNAIPSEPTTTTGGAAGRIQIGASANDQYITGSLTSPSAAALNRPPSEWGTPAQIAPQEQRDLPGPGQPGFAAPNTIQGAPLSPQEQQFWAQNPQGAILNPQGGLSPIPTNGSAPTGPLVPPEVFGTAPTQPGAPTNYGEAINDHYESQRAAIQDKKQQLMVHLGMADPSTIGASGTTLFSQQGGRRSQYQQGLEQLRDLTSQENQLLNEHRSAVIENARMTHENISNQAHIDAANNITKLSTGLDYVNQHYQKGTPQYQSAITELLQDPQIAQAVTTKGGQSILAPHLKAHEDTAAVAQRLQQSGYTVTPSNIGTAGGVSYSVKPAGTQQNVPEGALISHGRLLDLVAAHEQAAQKEAAANTTANKPNTPYSQSARLQANRQALSDLETRYPTLGPKQATQQTAPAATATPAPTNEVQRTTQDGRTAVFDSQTKKFLRYAQ